MSWHIPERIQNNSQKREGLKKQNKKDLYFASIHGIKTEEIEKEMPKNTSQMTNKMKRPSWLQEEKKVSIAAFTEIIVSEFDILLSNMIKKQEELQNEIIKRQSSSKLEAQEMLKGEQEIKKLQKELEELFPIAEELVKIRDEVEAKKEMRLKEKIMQYRLNESEVIDIKEEMVQYLELFESSLYDEAFMLLEKNLSKKDDDIERNKHIRDFIGFIVDKKYFLYLITNRKLPLVASTFVGHFMEKDYLQNMASKLGNFIEEDRMNNLFSSLVLSGDFEKAKFILKWAINDIEPYKNTLNTIFNTKNTEALKFLCANLTNIHFGEDYLLKMSYDMPEEAIAVLIDKHKFDMNAYSNNTGNNFIMTLINENNIRNFKFLTSSYGDQINWGSSKKEKNRTISIFDMIDRSKFTYDYYAIVLDNLTLSANHLERISTSLFKDISAMEQSLQKGLFEKLFSHPNFNPLTVNLGQSHCLYGLLSKFGGAVLSRDTDSHEYVKAYFKVLTAYTKTSVETTIPDAESYHILGAALMVAKGCYEKNSEKENEKYIYQMVSLILESYPQYLNKYNPNSNTLPINQTVKDSSVYQLLVQKGAVVVDSAPSFWGNLGRTFGKRSEYDNQMESLRRAQELAEKVTHSSEMLDTTPLSRIRTDMRDSFRDMKQLLSHELCDPTIKYKCETMFLQSERVLKMMERHNVKDAVEDVLFLSQNFSKYLKKSLEVYIEVCKATIDLVDPSKQEIIERKLEKAKENCLEQVNSLGLQVEAMSNNLLLNVESDARKAQNIQQRFLREKLSGMSSRVVDSDMSEDSDDSVVSIDLQQPSSTGNKEVEKEVVSVETDDTKNAILRQQERLLNLSEQIQEEIEMEIGSSSPSRNKMKV